jgi:hypothetical protein
VLEGNFSGGTSMITFQELCGDLLRVIGRWQSTSSTLSRSSRTDILESLKFRRGAQLARLMRSIVMLDGRVTNSRYKTRIRHADGSTAARSRSQGLCHIAFSRIGELYEQRPFHCILE